MCRSWKMLWRFRRAIQESHIFSVLNFALINFQLEVSYVFFNQGEHMQIRQRVRKKTNMRLQQHCTSFLHSLQHYCLSFRTSALLHTAALYLFRFIWKKEKKKKTSCVTEIWPTMAPNIVAQKRRWRVVLTVARLMRCFAAESPRHVRPFCFRTADTRRSLQGWRWCSLKKKDWTNVLDTVHDGNVKCGWRSGAVCPAGCEAACSDYDDSLKVSKSTHRNVSYSASENCVTNATGWQPQKRHVTNACSHEESLLETLAATIGVIIAALFSRCFAHKLKFILDRTRENSSAWICRSFRMPETRWWFVHFFPHWYQIASGVLQVGPSAVHSADSSLVSTFASTKPQEHNFTNTLRNTVSHCSCFT